MDDNLVFRTIEEVVSWFRRLPIENFFFLCVSSDFF